MPEPLDMEVGFVLTHGNNYGVHNIIIDRSRILAKQLVDKLKAKKTEKSTPQNLHLVTGLSHESQIQYFLLNPDYDMRKSLKKAANSARK